jgi:NDP-sugar pyrophosphorylase family protein
MEAVIYGAGEFGREAAGILKEENSVDVIGFLDDDRSNTGDCIDRLRVIGTGDDLVRFRRFGVEGICVAAVSGVERIRIAKMAEKAGYYLLTVRSAGSSISPDAHLGRGSIILEDSIIDSGAVIRHCCVIGRGVEIGEASFIPAGSNVFRNRFMRDGSDDSPERDLRRGICPARGGAESK